MTSDAEKNTTNGATREVATRTIHVPCGTRWAADCASCSETYRGRSHHAIRSGLPAEGERARVLLVTLTAPSFGPVHSPGWKEGKERPANPRKCLCKRIHDPNDRQFVGAPLSPERYDYQGAVQWNESAGALWCSWRKRLNRAMASLLTEDASVHLCRVVEPQRRGLAHFHVLVVVRPGESGYLPFESELIEAVKGTLPTPAAARASIRAAMAEGKKVPAIDEGPSALAVDGTGSILHFGAMSDVRPMRPGPTGWNGVAGYLSKYLTKTTGGMEAVPAQQGSNLQKHLDHMASIAVARARESWPEKHNGAQPRNGDLTRVERSLGYNGPPRSATRSYGLTLKDLKAAACEYNNTGEVAEWVPLWVARPDLRIDLRKLAVAARAAAVAPSGP